MAGEVGRVAVVVEVVEVGEQEGRAAGVDRGPRRLPGVAVALLEGAQLERRAGQLAEVLLEAGGAAVEPAARRGVLEGDVVEAGAGAEPEGHLLADLDAVEARAGCAARSSRSGGRGCGCSRGRRASDADYPAGRRILRAVAERRPQTAPRDADPRAHARRSRSARAGAGQGGQQRRGLGRDRGRPRPRRLLEPRGLADLRRARPGRDRRSTT